MNGDLVFDQNPTFYKKAFAKTNGHKCVFLSSIQKGPITDLKCEPYNMFCIHIFPCPSHYKFNHPAILIRLYCVRRRFYLVPFQK